MLLQRPQAHLRDSDVPGISYIRLSSEWVGRQKPALMGSSLPSSGKTAQNILWIQWILLNIVARHSSWITINLTS